MDGIKTKTNITSKIFVDFFMTLFFAKAKIVYILNKRVIFAQTIYGG